MWVVLELLIINCSLFQLLLLYIVNEKSSGCLNRQSLIFFPHHGKILTFYGISTYLSEGFCSSFFYFLK